MKTKLHIAYLTTLLLIVLPSTVPAQFGPQTSLGTQRAPSIPVPPRRTIIQPAPLRPSSQAHIRAFSFDYNRFTRSLAGPGNVPAAGIPTSGPHHLDPNADGRGPSRPNFTETAPRPQEDVIYQQTLNQLLEVGRKVDETERSNALETKEMYDRMLQQMGEARATITGADIVAVMLKQSGLRKIRTFAEEIARTLPVFRERNPDTLYVDEYPLPADAKWEKLGSMEKARMPWLNPDGLYLSEGASERDYDTDGFLKEPTRKQRPDLAIPRFEKMSPGERRRVPWLPDSPEQMYLVE